jgi:HK97 family phage major capsid protein
MTSDTMKVPAWAGATHSSTLYGGFSGAWLSEGETATRETPTLRQIELNAHKLGIFVAASSELAADGIGFEEQLARAMVKAISWYAEEAFIAGTGAGQPLGLLNDPAKIAITPSGGVGSIGASDLINALARLHPACYQNALWIASSEVMGKIWLMADGMGNPIYRPEEVNGQGRLMGLPVRVSEHCSQVGTEGDLILCDPTQYVIGLRKDAILEKTNAASWTSDQVDYRVLLRVDGQGSWESAITPANGGDSLSYVVTIGTRS